MLLEPLSSSGVTGVHRSRMNSFALRAHEFLQPFEMNAVVGKKGLVIERKRERERQRQRG